MKCKKVYDIIGHFKVEHKDYISVHGAILLPYVMKDGKEHKLSVKICSQTNISSGGFNAYFLTIKCAGKNSSLRNEEVKDYFSFELKIQKKHLDFTKEKKLRLIVFHDDKMCEEPDPDLIDCARDYVRQAGYLQNWTFRSRRCGEWVSMHGPKKSGESVMVGM